MRKGWRGALEERLAMAGAHKIQTRFLSLLYTGLRVCAFLVPILELARAHHKVILQNGPPRSRCTLATIIAVVIIFAVSFASRGS